MHNPESGFDLLRQLEPSEGAETAARAKPGGAAAATPPESFPRSAPWSASPTFRCRESLGMHEIDLEDGAVRRVSGVANPKSSSGRLDIFTRLITDGAREFTTRISPRAFSIDRSATGSSRILRG